MRLKYRDITIIIFLLLLPQLVFGGPSNIKWNAQYQSYINQYKDIAIKEMLKYGIPASITL